MAPIVLRNVEHAQRVLEHIAARHAEHEKETMPNTEIVKAEGREIQQQPEPETLSIENLVAQVRLIQQATDAVMRKDEHYGVIPGTGGKPTLLKAGAEKLCLLFRMDPQYSVSTEHAGEHREITATCTLYHIPSGRRLGSGMGSCSTRESKYAWRKAERTCPKCGSGAVIKGKDDYGGGWLCWAKKGGCGAKFKDGDAAIEGQKTDRVPNPDLADQYNTVLKMATKRSLVAAVLNATAASDVFTQDIEDLPDFQRDVPPAVSPHGHAEPGETFARTGEEADIAIRAFQDAATLDELSDALHALAWTGPTELEQWPPPLRKAISAAYRRRERQLAKGPKPPPPSAPTHDPETGEVAAEDEPQ